MIYHEKKKSLEREEPHHTISKTSIYIQKGIAGQDTGILAKYIEKNIDNQPDLILPGSENVSMICHASHPKSIPKLHCHCHPAPKDNPI